VSQSDLAPESWSVAYQLETAEENSENAVALGLTVTPADYQALLEELAQAQALDQERTTRIYHLEQALDQALACLDELRLQIQDQQILETQLATTEEFSYVQQQAIARLKLQLSEQQQALEAQILETQQRDQAIQELLATIEGMTQVQQQELERLKSRISQDQIEVQTHRNRLGKQLQDLQTALESRQQRVSKLESETLATRSLNVSLQGQLEAAQQQIKELSASLCQYRVNLTQLTQLEQSQIALGERHSSAVLAQRHQSAPEQPPTIVSLQQDIAKAQRRMEELEEQLTQRTMYQTRWQQNHQEIEAERDRLQTRVIALEQQVAEMQEQILQQAQQATEQETAIQYWKDRYGTSHRQIAHLRDLLDQVLSCQLVEADGTPRPLPAELLSDLQMAIAPEKSELGPLPVIPLPRLGTVELPEFLVRRRAQQAGGQGTGTRA
jgi:chromosome segregation ATPase